MNTHRRGQLNIADTSGASLVEVLVTLVIVVLLAVILNQSLGGARSIINFGKGINNASGDAAAAVDYRTADSQSSDMVSIIRDADGVVLGKFPATRSVYVNEQETDADGNPTDPSVSYAVIGIDYAEQDIKDQTAYDQTALDLLAWMHTFESSIVEDAETNPAYTGNYFNKLTLAMRQAFYDEVAAHPSGALAQDVNAGLFNINCLRYGYTIPGNVSDDMAYAAYYLYYNGSWPTMPTSLASTYGFNQPLYIRPYSFCSANAAGFYNEPSFLIGASTTAARGQRAGVVMLYDPLRMDDPSGGNSSSVDGTGHWFRCPNQNASTPVNQQFFYNNFTISIPTAIKSTVTDDDGNVLYYVVSGNNNYNKVFYLTEAEQYLNYLHGEGLTTTSGTILDGYNGNTCWVEIEKQFD